MKEIEFEEFEEAEGYDDWVKNLDYSVCARLEKRLDKYEEDKKLPNTAGWLQDTDGIGEIRFDFGPGYRIYFCRFKHVVLLLLTGGTKKTQFADIEKAKIIKAQEIARLEAEKEPE